MGSTRNIIRDYEGDKLACDYDTLRPDYPNQIKDVVLDCLRKNSTSSARNQFLLDVGCGGGKSTRLFSSEFENIMGIDVSRAQLTVARKNHTKNINYVLVDSDRFPVKSNTVDVVLCATALHYLDPPSFFAECDRVLKDGGIVAVTTYTTRFLKAPNSSMECDLFSKNSKYRQGLKTFFRDCGMNETARKHCLNGYKYIFNSIKNPTKRWESEIHVERKYTLGSFLELMKTCAGYYKIGNRELAKTPLKRFCEALHDIFYDNGLECKDDTEFTVTFGFPVLIIEKKNGLKIE